MSAHDHIEYFERRRDESARLALQAGEDPIAHLYRQFAIHYGRIVDEAKSTPRIAYERHSTGVLRKSG